jgi:hypothetical protein
MYIMENKRWNKQNGNFEVFRQIVRALTPSNRLSARRLVSNRGARPQAIYEAGLRHRRLTADVKTRQSRTMNLIRLVAWFTIARWANPSPGF